MTYEELKKFWR